MRDQTVRYEEVVDLARQPDPEMAVMDELFDGVTALNNLLKKIPLDVFRKEKAKIKWMNIFSTNHSFPYLNKLKRVICGKDIHLHILSFFF